MSKAAVAILTRQFAAELIHASIDVVAICPGATNTRMFQASTLDPMTPAEIAKLIVFLASDFSAPRRFAPPPSTGLGDSYQRS